MSEEQVIENTNVSEQQQPEPAKTEAQPQEETPEQINWRKFRQERAEAEAKRKEAEERATKTAAEAEALKAALESVLNKPSPMQQHYESQYEEENEDKLLERKLENILQARDAKMREEQKKREMQELPQKLNQTFSDFGSVCNQENLDYMEFHHPEIAKAFQHMPDSFDKWASVYTAVKKLVPNPNSKKDEKRIDQNLSKPQSMSIPGITQTGDSAPNYLDDAKKKANWERMVKVRKMV